MAAVNIQELFLLVLINLFVSFVHSFIHLDVVLSNSDQIKGFCSAYFVPGVRIMFTLCSLSGRNPLLIQAKDRITDPAKLITKPREWILSFPITNKGLHNIQLNLIKNKFTKTITFYFMATECLFKQDGFT